MRTRRTGSRKFPKAKRSRLGLWVGLIMAVLIGSYVGVLELSRPHVEGDKLRFDGFVRLVTEDRIREAKILDEDAYAVGRYLRDDGSEARYNAPLVRGTQAGLLNLLIQADVPTTIDQQVSKRVASLASVLLPGLILMVLFVYLVLSYRKGTGLFGITSGARRITATEGGVTFADVAGQDAAVTELREIKDFLREPQRFTDVGAVVPKGVLLYGPPGCGKTLLARAVAQEAGASFFSISGSDFVELYVGVGAARVRDLFKEAREHAPSIIFIDELDSIGRVRGGGGGGHAVSSAEQEQGLNQILAEMDGFSSSEGILVIGATNRPDILDPALLRPGRFDRTVGLERPDEKARLAILALHAQGKRLEPTADLAVIARRAMGLTGADLASVINEGALLAARAARPAVSQPDLDQALRRILEAPERQRRLSLRQRRVGRRFADEERVTFADVAGVDDAVDELAEVKEYLASSERFSRLGVHAPRGILLSGPPGCGKTLLARAVAGEANAAFLSVSASEFVEVFVGEGAARVRELFAEARSVAPAIVFIDEIDAIGGRRSAVAVGGQHETEQTLNQILVELDGFEERGGVIVMAATNRPDMLDTALVRPGRFDRQVELTLPDREGRAAILSLHARGKPLGTDVDLNVVAGLTRGFSGADLANVMNEAGLLAARRGLDEIPMSLVDEGIDRAILGVASRALLMTDDERRSVAYHEAGHALVGLALAGGVAPHKLTIVPRGRSLGHCSMVDSHDRAIFSRSMLLDRMAGLLGGRTAEELASGDPTSGAADDLQRAVEIARRMVCELGMSDGLGLVVYPDGTGGQGQPRRHYSEEVCRRIDAEVRTLIDEAHSRALSVLTDQRILLDRVATALLERETLSASDLERLIPDPPGPFLRNP